MVCSHQNIGTFQHASKLSTTINMQRCKKNNPSQVSRQLKIETEYWQLTAERELMPLSHRASEETGSHPFFCARGPNGSG